MKSFFKDCIIEKKRAGKMMLFNRPEYMQRILQFKDTEFIKVITGVRRSGKSYLLLLYKEHLLNSGVKQENIIYISFEDYRNIHLLDEQAFFDYVEEQIVNRDKYYLMFDEVENVPGWQKVVNGLRMAYNVDITITGSNAELLSGELATLLAGRHVSIPVYPLSFKEFLYVKEGEEPNFRNLKKHYDEYIRYGGFPTVVLAQEEIKEAVLAGIYDTILLNDVGLRSGHRATIVIDRLAKYLADNVGQLVSAKKIADTLVSMNIKASYPTISELLKVFEQAYLFYRAERYDIRGKAYLSTQGKYYIVDSGLRHVALRNKIDNLGTELENVVYIELLRRGYEVDVGKWDTKEIDFVARKMNETIYVQVALRLPENNTRESDNLLHIKDARKKIIITGQLEEQTEIDGIKIAYIIDWLLDDGR